MRLEHYLRGDKGNIRAHKEELTFSGVSVAIMVGLSARVCGWPTYTPEGEPASSIPNQLFPVCIMFLGLNNDYDVETGTNLTQWAWSLACHLNRWSKTSYCEYI